MRKLRFTLLSYLALSLAGCNCSNGDENLLEDTLIYLSLKDKDTNENYIVKQGIRNDSISIYNERGEVILLDINGKVDILFTPFRNKEFLINNRTSETIYLRIIHHGVDIDTIRFDHHIVNNECNEKEFKNIEVFINDSLSYSNRNWSQSIFVTYFK